MLVKPVPFDNFRDLFVSKYIGGTDDQLAALTLVGRNLIPTIARPLSEVGDGMSLLGQVSSGLGLTDPSDGIYETVSLPVSSDLPELRGMLNAAHQLADGVTMDQFIEALDRAQLQVAVSVNGIQNDYWQAIAQGTSIATERGMVVINLYNPAHSLVADSVETILTDLHIDTADVAAARIAIGDAMTINQKLNTEAPTIVYAHSEGTAIANEAIAGFEENVQRRLQVYNYGTATGRVPAYLASFMSVENRLDPVPMLVSNVVGFGGVETSPGYKQGISAGRNYSVVHTSFDIPGSMVNHSMTGYFTDSVSRNALGFGNITAALADLYAHSPWAKH